MPNPDNQPIDPFALAYSGVLHRTLRDLVHLLEMHSHDRGAHKWTIAYLCDHSLTFRDAVKVLEDIDRNRLTPQPVTESVVTSNEPF